MSHIIRNFREILGNLGRILRHHHGVLGTAKSLFVMDDAKYGELVGEDKFGNKYFQNNAYFFGRNRWVQYSDDVFLNYDGSQIPPEWHRWLHHTTDDPPTLVPPTPRKFIKEHRENMSGTSLAYTPYSTTRPKQDLWKKKPAGTQSDKTECMRRASLDLALENESFCSFLSPFTRIHLGLEEPQKTQRAMELDEIHGNVFERKFSHTCHAHNLLPVRI